MLLVSACGGSSGGNATVDSTQGKITVVLQNEPSSMDPCDSHLSANGPILVDNITEPLVHLDVRNNTLSPRLALSWIQTTPTVWTFKLRTGVTFHDGKPFNAEAVAWWVNRVINPAAQCYALGSVLTDNVLSAKAVDDTTVDISLKTPDPILPLSMAFVDIGAPTADPLKKATKPVGTGPYQFTNYTPGSDFNITRYANYWGDAPQIGSVDYKFRSESSVRAAMASTHEVDVAAAIGPQDAKADGAITYTVSETLYYRINLDVPLLNDIRIRRALNYAIDRQTLINNVYNGLGEPASEIFLPTVAGSDPSVKWDYQPEKAKQLIAEAKADGVPVDKTIDLIGETGIRGSNGNEVDDTIRAMLTAVGFKARVATVEDTAPVIAKPQDPAANPELIQNVHGNSFGDGYISLAGKLGCGGPQSLVCDQSLENLLAAGSAASGADRAAKLQAASRYIFQNVVPLIPLAYLKNTLIIANPLLHYEPDSSTSERMPIAEFTVSEDQSA
jgi:peptide/nickel transport system substrate-binding protein